MTKLVQLESEGLEYYLLGFDQGGKSRYGWVVFPIRFNKFRSIVTDHQGVTYMNSRVEEFNSLDGMTLKVGSNSDDTEDAQWIACGI